MPQFRDHSIVVENAEEPKNLIWEYSDYSKSEIRLWNVISWIFTLILLIMALII